MVTKAALAGLLALLLLAAATVSVSQSLHRLLHNSDSAHAHPCLVCSLSNGQVNAAVVALVPAILVLGFLFGIRLPGFSPLPRFDHRLSPSRAPPRG